MRAALGLALLLAAGAAAAAPETSPRPEPRPGAVMPYGPGLGPAVVSVWPEARPADIASRARSARAAVAGPARSAGADPSVRRAVGPVSALCGSRAILGEPLAPIPGRVSGCGIAEPMRVMAVSGVRLSRPAVMDCNTARTLAGWVEGSVKPAIGDAGGGVMGLQVMAGYQCRTRNNRPGARISEHGRGRAIDIGAFLLADGRRITVLKGWGRPKQGRILRELHAAACGPFGTVLGPRSDRHHRDHFHLDTAPRRATAYCR